MRIRSQNCQKMCLIGVVIIAVSLTSVISGETTVRPECIDVTCHPLSNSNQGQQILEIGEKIILNRTGCCPTLQTICDTKLCPKRPSSCANKLAEIEVIKGRCCQSYRCLDPVDKCLVELGHEKLILNAGEVIPDPFDVCLQHECKQEGFKAIAITTQEVCDENCPNGYLYKEPSEEKCCGKCVHSGCQLETKLYHVGESWKSEDNCTIYECSITESGFYQISSFQKSCSVLTGSCPKEYQYMMGCCLYCNDTAKKEKLEQGSQIPLVDPVLDVPHPCVRECIEGEVPKVCNYTFVVEWYETLSKACYDCPYNVSDCDRSHCIGTDGARRSVVVINRMMPGPTIDVCLGDTIVVDVKNHLLGESTTMHWHGLHQKENPYMDGVPHISQCPIHPHATFRYKFKADNPGTHFWHSHTGMQRGDGAFGALIIRRPVSTDPHSKLYDFDMVEHVMSLNDWAHEPGVSMFSSHHHSSGDNKPPNLLINGKGRFYQRTELQSDASTVSVVTEKVATSTGDGEVVEESTDPISTTPTTLINIEPNDNDNLNEASPRQKRRQRISATNLLTPVSSSSSAIPAKPHIKRERVLLASDESKYMPLEVFKVTKNYRYRFRVINAGFLNCPIELSVDDHNLTVIASDGFDLEPVEVASLVLYAGERFDFILYANQKINNYWIRYRGLMDCDERFTSAHQVAILRYKGSAMEDPSVQPTYDYERKGLQLNSLNKGSGEEDTKTMAEVNALDEDLPELLKPEPDYKFFVYYDFYEKDNPHFHLAGQYGFTQIQHNNSRVLTPQLNHISMKMPSLPLMPSHDLLDDSNFCNESSLAAKNIDCRTEFCECSHVYQVKLNSVVELILIDEGFAYDANHPFHLHGYGFRVVGMERLGKNVTVEQIKALDAAGKIHRRLKNAPIKDTVTVPDGGYTIVRFLANNPGYWLLHCHIEFHAEIGMALVFKVGEHSDFVPVPQGFPQCQDYMPVEGGGSSDASLRRGPSIGCSLIVIFLLIRYRLK